MASMPIEDVPRRILFAVPVVAATAVATALFVRLLKVDGWSGIDAALTPVFVVLFAWIFFWFWAATLGFFIRLRRQALSTKRRPSLAPNNALPPTAIVMPVYNESPARVFARVRAILESLDETGQREAFDFFVLSDSTDPDVWAQEEVAWGALRCSLRGGERVFYRHRPKNHGRKSGNIADFCERWGGRFRYMVVLDADSVMSGTTLVELVRRMERAPDVGILQAPSTLVNGASLFARLQQFAASVYGPVFATGMAFLCRSDGNYYGHNAIIRLEAFISNCGLPKLPGEAPFGGEILSHDFVEAALIRRAGWKVELAWDLDGSYEECPATLQAFAIRDRRWCQGNLQHVRLVFAKGLHPMSRLHFAVGSLFYLASPLWALFLALATCEAIRAHHAAVFATMDALVLSRTIDRAQALFVTVFALLLAPKLWGLFILLLDPVRRKRHGGMMRVTAGVLGETALTAVFAPVVMALHTGFVLSILIGRTVEWTTTCRNQRRAQIEQALRMHGSHTIMGAMLGTAAWQTSTALFWWLVPILTGLVLALPFSFALSSTKLGTLLRRIGLFATPEERDPPSVLTRVDRYASNVDPRSSAESAFTELVLDPKLNDMHIALLRAFGGRCISQSRLALLCRRVLALGPNHLTHVEKLALLSDEASMRSLHHNAWRTWPLDRLTPVPRLS